MIDLNPYIIFITCPKIYLLHDLITISNYFLFKLQRHSDHHAFAHKPYQILKSYDESPLLPQGYMMMVILAWYPSLYFEIMNETLIRYKN